MSQVIDSLEITHNSQIISNHPSYAWDYVYPKTSSQSSITLSSSTNPELNLEVPSQVYNWHRGFLELLFTPAAGGNGYYNYLPADCISMIRNLEIYTNSGVYVVRLNDAHKYTHMLGRHETTLDRANSNDNFNGGLGFMEGLRTCNSLTTDNNRADGTDGHNHYFEPTYYTIGGSNSATPVIRVRYRLSNFYYNSILHEDKDQFFPEILNVRIVFNTTNLIMHKSTDAADPSTNAAAYTGNITLSNIRLVMCREKNQVIEAQLKNQIYTTGLTKMVPFVWNHKFNLNTASQNTSIIIGPHNGRRLMRIYRSVYENSETSNTAYDRDNVASAKIVSFYTTVNSDRQQISDLTCSTYDDYALLRYYTEGSCIFSYNEWMYNNLWIEDFCNPQSCTERRRQIIHNDVIDGKPIDKDIRYEIINTTVNDTFNHYIYVVTLRELTINSTGIFLT